MDKALLTPATLQQDPRLNHFSERRVRHLIFHAGANGLAASGALIRIGRRILIDPDAFMAWLNLHRQGGSHVNAA